MLDMQFQLTAKMIHLIGLMVGEVKDNIGMFNKDQMVVIEVLKQITMVMIILYLLTQIQLFQTLLYWVLMMVMD